MASERFVEMYPSDGVLAGTWNDTATPAPAAATANQLGVEAVNAAAHFGNTDAAANRNAQYVIVSPSGAHPTSFNAGAGFCAWHDFSASPYVGAPSPYGDIAFTNLPYLPDAGQSCGANYVNAGPAGLLDGVTMVAGHEYAETLTDQNPAGGWTDSFGEENADKCAWISSGPGQAQNVDFATGSFAMQSTWSNDGAACLMTHPIWGVSDGPNDFAALAAPASAFTTVGGSVGTDLSLVTVTGNVQPVVLSASGLPPATTGAFSSGALSSDGSATFTLTTSNSTPFGTYPIMLTAAGSITRTATFTVTVGPPPIPLANGVAVTGIAGPGGSDQFWQLAVPAGESVVDFTIRGSVPGADLYVRRGDLPTLTDFDCTGGSATSNESCLSAAAAGMWYVRLHASLAFSDLTLIATYASSAALTSDVPLRDLAGASGSSRYFLFRVGAGTRRVKVSIKGGLGDADLYVRRDGIPGREVWDCAPTRRGGRGRKETCKIKHPVAGTYYVLVRGLSDYSGLKLKTVIG